MAKITLKVNKYANRVNSVLYKTSDHKFSIYVPKEKVLNSFPNIPASLTITIEPA